MSRKLGNHVIIVLNSIENANMIFSTLKQSSTNNLGDINQWKVKQKN